MTDIVERLRAPASIDQADTQRRLAADEIERLRERDRRITDQRDGLLKGLDQKDHDIEWLRHQIHFIQDMILRHKAEQTADPRCMCSEMDANLWAWAEDREGDLPR